MPNDKGEYHEYEEEVTCDECGNDEASCVCDEDVQDLSYMDVCVHCGEYEDDPVHEEV
jgi:hypothetical protein